MMTALTLATASLQIGFRRALACYPAYPTVGSVSSALSLWVMFREWVLGRHLTSWIGQQDRKTVITPMSGQRALAVTGLGIGAGPAAAVIGNVTHRDGLTLAGVGATTAALIVLHHGRVETGPFN
jgi:hypothetical protein